MLKSREKVICTSHTFISVRNVIDVWTKMHGADVVCLEIPSAVKDENQVNLAKK